MKRKSGLRRFLFLFLLLLPAAGAALLYFPVDLTRIPKVRALVDEWRALGISADRISVTMRGRIHARGLTLGNPAACVIGDMTLDLSLAQLLKGRIVFYRASGNSILLDWGRLRPFFEGLRRKIPRRYLQGRLLSLEIRGRGIRVNGVVPSRPLLADGAVLSVKWRPSPAIRIRAQGARLEGFPAVAEASFRFAGGPESFALEDLSAHWLGASLQGEVTMRPPAGLEGTLAFERVDLGRLAASRLGEDQALEGLARGAAAFEIDLARGSLEAAGSLLGERLRLRNFPAQKAELVRNYMPALHDARFREFRVGRWLIRDGKVHLESLAAEGHPLSVDGGGWLEFSTNPFAADSGLQGRVRLSLNGRLDERYYRSLSPMAKLGIVRNAAGAPAFWFLVQGDFQKQGVYTDKSLSRAVKSITSRIGEKFKRWVGP